MKKMTCVIPGCERTDIIARGLCPRDYKAVARLVRLGRTTWEELERLGKVRPLRRSAAADWVLGTKNQKPETTNEGRTK